ncbi:MAG TPA: PDZ domain-containing protein, partial [Mucilaginibacter sp.]
KTNDLVLLKPSAKISGGIRLTGTDTLHKPHPGVFLISPQPDTASIASVLGSRTFDLQRKTSLAFSGATAAHNSSPAKIYFVRANSLAAVADIKIGDVVKSINGTPVSNAGEYSAQMLRYWPGDTIVLQLDRSGTAFTKTILLTYPPEMKYNHPAENFAGGKSVRRDGFTGIYSHDGILKPSQCGGPVIDLEGRCLGINIARFSRVNSIIIPMNTVLTLVGAAEAPLNSRQ